MAMCHLCNKPFSLNQSYANLFSFNNTCSRCTSIKKIPLKTAYIPLQQAMLILYSFDHEEHPALTAVLFEEILSEGALIFYQQSFEKNLIELVLLHKLFDPLKIVSFKQFSPEFINNF